MEVGIAIGETHRFELREALLIYTENRNGAFITRHAVTAQEAGPPTLGPAQPLTMAFVESGPLHWRRGTGRGAGGECAGKDRPDAVLVDASQAAADVLQQRGREVPCLEWQGLPAAPAGVARE
jgi:hypothetical protein